MTARKVSYDQFMAAMEAAVEERGEDWVYPKVQYDAHGDQGLCRYSKSDGTPACIVGEVLYRLNPEWLPDHSLITSARRVLNDIGRDAFYKRDYDRIVLAAVEAQRNQDNGKTWGYSLHQARRATE